MIKNHEDTVTTLLATKIVELRPAWDVQVQQYFSCTSKRPDLIVTVPGNSPVLIEAKWDATTDAVELQAADHIGVTYSIQADDGERFENAVDSALAIRYPTEWQRLPLQQLIASIATDELQMTCIKEVNGAITYLTGESPMQSTIEGLVCSIQFLSATPWTRGDATTEEAENTEILITNDELRQKMEDTGVTYQELGTHLGYANGGTVWTWLKYDKPIPPKHHPKIIAYLA